MESLQNTELLEFPPNTLKVVRGLFGLDKSDEMNDAVNILDQWIKQQNHFTKKDFSREYLERTIILCKGSIEKAKRRIDKLCTYKTLLPKYFAYSNVSEELNCILSFGWFAVLPKLTKDYYRVSILKLKNTNFSPSDLNKLQCGLTIICEYFNMYDYCAGYILINDYSDINVMDAIPKIDVLEIQQFLPIVTDGYGGRVKSLVWLTESKLIHGFIKILKSLLSEKMRNRIHAFADLESLHKLCSKDILPLEYGGREKSIEELHNNLVKTLSSKEHVEYVKEMLEAKTDETKRAVHEFNEQYMGMAGTFRTLRVD